MIPPNITLRQRLDLMRGKALGPAHGTISINEM
ncbi:MAG: hypothetical protein JWR09_5867 [Mucilaginibacter sp.]|nr:hypothetical protein [Mucilaginibacter sp.]